MQTPAFSSSALYPNAQPFSGIVENTVQALRLVNAARLGVIPRVIRRLNDAERRDLIVSGAVFVFSVVESGIRRWTDGLLFSPSRIDGNFLVSSGGVGAVGRIADRRVPTIRCTGRRTRELVVREGQTPPKIGSRCQEWAGRRSSQIGKDDSIALKFHLRLPVMRLPEVSK